MDARIHARFGDAARLLGDTSVKLVEHGPFAWLETEGVLSFQVRALFLVDDKWVPMERNLAAFEQLLARVRPPLEDVDAIVRAHSSLTFDEPLLSEDQLSDLSDPRWHVFPIEDPLRDVWHTPRFDGNELVWFVERFPHRADMARVRIDREYCVVVESVA